MELMHRLRFTCEGDGGRGDKKIKGSDRSETSATVRMLWPMLDVEVIHGHTREHVEYGNLHIHTNIYNIRPN